MMRASLFVIGVLLLGALVLLIPFSLVDAAPLAQTATDGQAIFQQKCTSCHTIGKGPLVGPDLQGVTQRRDINWIRGFIAAPDKVIASGDPIAAQLLAQHSNIQMPNLGLKNTEIDALLAYLQNPAAAAQAPAANQPAAPLPPGSPLGGQKIFTGAVPLSGGGVNCIACHTVWGAGPLGGGSLGPDLTHVYTRYGEPGLAAALNQIAFPTMQGPFLNRPLSPQEQADLVAYFKWVNQAAPGTFADPRRAFFLLGGAGALALFAVMAIFWPRQRTSLSDRLRRSR